MMKLSYFKPSPGSTETYPRVCLSYSPLTQGTIVEWNKYGFKVRWDCEPNALGYASCTYGNYQWGKDTCVQPVLKTELLKDVRVYGGLGQMTLEKGLVVKLMPQFHPDVRVDADLTVGTSGGTSSCELLKDSYKLEPRVYEVLADMHKTFYPNCICEGCKPPKTESRVCYALRQSMLHSNDSHTQNSFDRQFNNVLEELLKVKTITKDEFDKLYRFHS